ncbi:alpha-glucosidase [Schaalia suimastitidis]|uniref:alpha-glucosidase n=1 Tax=Schaalia suimastitidis TaxID=121163 RepID=UPI00041D3EA8|nr:alpha-glucosidase [Schaalia suimastitidis]
MTQAAPWWKTSTVYQIYPRSFQDSNGDGVGDVAGITRRIGYLKELGIDIVWLSPVFASPMVDNGYDISDYEAIDPLFGSNDDMDELIAAASKVGIRIILDLVVNHTSNQHPWFIESLDPRSPKRDWYIWRAPRAGASARDVEPGQWRGDEPNRWVSAFSGPVWTWHPQSGQYYLHFFAPEQPDLNWENPRLRAEIYAMMRRWLERGISGFRMDVINCISKPATLCDDTDGGIDRAFFGPRFHEWMQEMRREVFDYYPDRVFFTVGETPGATLADAQLSTDPRRKELDMIFQFEHMEFDATHGDKFTPCALPLAQMKKSLARWSNGLYGCGWNSLYLSNHDRPRTVSRFGSPELFRYQSATAWAGMLHAHQGTPFVYQGEELGMANYPWSDITQFNDVETRGLWRDRVEFGDADAQTLWEGILHASRDNARTPMQWDDTPHAGFTTGTPWLPVNPDYIQVNAKAQQDDASSIFAFYRRLIALRKELPIIIDGTVDLLAPDHTQLWHIRRRISGQVLEAVANMSDTPLDYAVPEGNIVIANYPPSLRRSDRLQPWELRWVLTQA